MDKGIHLIEYGVLSLLCLYSLRKSVKSNFKTAIVLAIIFSGFYGVSDELHQYFVPGREFSAGDMAADLLGAILFQSGNILKLKFSG